MSNRRVKILNCEFDPWNTQETLDQIKQLVLRNERAYLCTVNVAILMMMRSIPQLAEFVSKAKMIVADGLPLIWVSKYLNKPLPERVTGVELVDDLAELASENNWGIYLLGGTEEVVGSVASQLKSALPDLIVSGYCDGYFDSAEAKLRAQAVRESGAKILIVAMGVPRQEQFIEDQWPDLGVNFVIGVGGSFDVISGVTKRAPVWMQKSGLEWLFRTMQEPRRLAWRYISTNSLFIFLVFKEILFKSNRNSDTA